MAIESSGINQFSRVILFSMPKACENEIRVEVHLQYSGLQKLMLIFRRKHDLRHRKPFKCGCPGCPRIEGFSTTNDLDRHTKSKHPLATTSKAEPMKKYHCVVPGCTSKDKAWPRLDNFRSHLRRTHEAFIRLEENFEELIRR